MLLNASQLNSVPLNSTSGRGFDDWTLLAPVERQVIYVLDIGEYRVPISSAQATMRANGQSFLQAVIPNASEHAAEIAGRLNETMALLSGYRYADNTLSPLEAIAQAPFQLSSQATGAINDTLTISGYGVRDPGSGLTRHLTEVQTRTIGQDGHRRVRCGIDLFLRPGHIARDSDDVEFTVGTIQYFINAVSEAMEVVQDG